MNTSKNQRVGRADNYRAKYLVLLDNGGAPRALLFDQDRHYLAELIDDDGLVLDNLMRVGTMCSMPADLALHSVANPLTMRCFTLG